MFVSSEYTYGALKESCFVSFGDHTKFSWFSPEGKCFLCRRYFRYLHTTNTIVFTIPSAIMQAIFHCASTIVTIGSVFGLLFIFQLTHAAASGHQLRNK